MKKLTFALACASTLALFAEPISVTGFEGDGSNGYGAESAESGSLWSYAAASGSTDGSAAKAYEGSDVSAPTITRPKQALEGGNLKFLDLSTEGGILWRKFAADGSHTVPSTGTYIDTMVQFTATEDGGRPPEVNTGDGDKLALWLDKAEDGTLTLKVLANAFTFDDGPAPAATSFALTTSDGSELVLAENAWYRLTVQSIANVLGATAPGTIQGFQIYVNGVRMKAASGEPFAAAFADFMDDYKTAALTDKTVFASLQQMGNLDGEGNPLTPATLASVGFKGSGKIDDLVLTDDDPFDLPTPASVDFTVTVPTGATDVKYAVGDGTPAGLPDNGKITGAEGATVTITGTLADGTSFTKTGTIVENGTLNLSTPDWSFYLAADAEAANTYVIDSAAELEDFRKGVAAGLVTADVTFKQTENITLTAPWSGVGLRTAESEQYAANNAAELTAFTASAKDLVSWAVAGTEVKAGNVTQAVGDARKAAYLAGAFRGTFDGGNYTISGVSLVKGDYVGFFNSTYGATIKNLKLAISGTGFADSATADFGGGVVAGVTVDTTIQDCETVAGGTFTGSKAVAGIVGYAGSGTVLKGCVNNLAVSSANEKVAGLVACAQNGNAQAYGENGVVVDGCQNLGNVSSEKADSSRASGLVSYTDSKVTFQGHNVFAGTVAAPSGVQSIINLNGGSMVVADGATFTVPAAYKTVNQKAVDGVFYATVADGVARLVKNEEAVAGANLKVMADGAPDVVLAKIDDAITLDTTLAPVTVTTTAENAYVAKADNVYTVTAKADAEFTVSIDPTEAEWTAELTLPTPTITGTEATGTWSPAEIVEPDAGTTNVYTYTVTVAATDTTKETTKSVQFKVYKNATVVYPEYITDDTTKGKFDTWANTYDITGDDRKTASMDAYLLNCAPAEAEAEVAAFKIVSISIDAEGNVTVIAPTTNTKKAAFNGTVEVKGCATVDGEYTLPVTDAAARFFKAFLK